MAKKSSSEAKDFLKATAEKAEDVQEEKKTSDETPKAEEVKAKLHPKFHKFQK